MVLTLPNVLHRLLFLLGLIKVESLRLRRQGPRRSTHEDDALRAKAWSAEEDSRPTLAERVGAACWRGPMLWPQPR